LLGQTRSTAAATDQREDPNFEADHEASLVHLLSTLAKQDYRFCTVTPTTHQRVTGKERVVTTDLRDIFGWNLPFAMEVLPVDLAQQMINAGILHEKDGMVRSALRVASLGRDLFLHSSFPTIDPDAVFFGPDTYRFARFIASALKRTGTLGTSSETMAQRPMRLLDVGCGSGAGGIFAARTLRARGIQVQLILNDINPKALTLAAANARAAGVEAICALGDSLAAVAGNFDLIVSNPPYLYDDAERLYRHGGERLGRALSVRIASESIARLNKNGRLLLYTGVAMTGARDPFWEEIAPVVNAAGCSWTYEEIDPDVFGEELDRPIYARAERIAAVGLMAQFPGEGSYAG